MIERYTDEGHPYRLILSLTSALPEKRARLVPIGQRYAVADLVEAMRRPRGAAGGPVNLAWVLMAGVNTGPEEARELARLLGGRARARLRHRRERSLSAASSAPRTRSAAPSSPPWPRQGWPSSAATPAGPDIHAACGMLAAGRA